MVIYVHVHKAASTGKLRHSPRDEGNVFAGFRQGVPHTARFLLA